MGLSRSFGFNLHSCIVYHLVYRSGNRYDCKPCASVPEEVKVVAEAKDVSKKKKDKIQLMSLMMSILKRWIQIKVAVV